MDIFLKEASICDVLLLVWCMLVKSEPICDQTQYLHPNRTCVECPVCLPGEELSEDCGFGDGGEGVCVGCEEGMFSPETSVAPCRRCTECNLLNRKVERACSPTSDTQCGNCHPWHYELQSLTGEVEVLCVPCDNHDTVHKECLHLTVRVSKSENIMKLPEGTFEEPREMSVKEETISVVLIGSAAASLIFLIALLLWLFLLTAERLKQTPECSPEPEGLLSTADLHHTPPLSIRMPTSSENTSLTLSAEDPTRGLNSPSPENEMLPTSIVINVTTNIKSSSQNTSDNKKEEKEEEQNCSTEEIEQKLQTIWEIAQGQSIEMLDYDSVQDLSLMLDSNTLRRLGRSLGVPPQVVAHLHSFQDLFQYLRTSSYTLLPQLAQAAALLPHHEVVSRIYRAVVNK